MAQVASCAPCWPHCWPGARSAWPPPLKRACSGSWQAAQGPRGGLGAEVWHECAVGEEGAALPLMVGDFIPGGGRRVSLLPCPATDASCAGAAAVEVERRCYMGPLWWTGGRAAAGCAGVLAMTRSHLTHIRRFYAAPTMLKLLAEHAGGLATVCELVQEWVRSLGQLGPPLLSQNVRRRRRFSSPLPHCLVIELLDSPPDSADCSK